MEIGPWDFCLGKPKNWDGGERSVFVYPSPECETSHMKGAVEEQGEKLKYLQDADTGTGACKFCGWGWEAQRKDLNT